MNKTNILEIQRSIRLIIIIITLIMICTFSLNTVYANVQSRPGTNIRGVDVPTHFLNIRNMEAQGQVLGLNAVIDSEGNEESSNNIDSHLMKATEYGAIVTLVQSQYGKKVNNISAEDTAVKNTATLPYSATNNMSGVFGLKSTNSYNGRNICFSAINKNQSEYSGIYKLIKNRYVNKYEDEKQKPGDASELLSYNTTSTSATYWSAYYYRGDWSLRLVSSGYAYAVIVNGTGV